MMRCSRCKSITRGFNLGYGLGCLAGLPFDRDKEGGVPDSRRPKGKLIQLTEVVNENHLNVETTVGDQIERLACCN